MNKSALQIAFLMLGSIFSVACSAAPDKDSPVTTLSVQPLTELEGKVEVKGTADKPITLFTTSGKTYTITGKLERMIRGSYKNKTIKLAGTIVQESSEKKPGIFEAKEIVVILY
ncbi:MAG: hypothetical protein K8S54_01230 [Spirochaetia bacterium]|nr:hypothetical protein [Spirochaetia bacterium]